MVLLVRTYREGSSMYANGNDMRWRCFIRSLLVGLLLLAGCSLIVEPPTATPTSAYTITPLIVGDPLAVYRLQMEAWLLDARAWAASMVELGDDLDAWQEDIFYLEQDAQALLTALQAIQPPDAYADTHRMAVASMQNCVEAMGDLRQGNIELGAIMLDTCGAGFGVILDRLNAP